MEKILIRFAKRNNLLINYVLFYFFKLIVLRLIKKIATKLILTLKCKVNFFLLLHYILFITSINFAKETMNRKQSVFFVRWYWNSIVNEMIIFKCIIIHSTTTILYSNNSSKKICKHVIFAYPTVCLFTSFDMTIITA